MTDSNRVSLRFDSSAEEAAGDDYGGGEWAAQTECADGEFAERYAFENAAPVAGDLVDVLADGFDDVVDRFKFGDDVLSVCFRLRNAGQIDR